jgi:eukaryotic-like serine/threonine-protein kinase
MSSDRRPLPVPLTMAAGTADTGSEANRAFFQERLAMMTGWACVLSLGFLVVLVIAQFSLRPAGHANPLGWPHAFHLGIAVSNGGVWLATRTASLPYVWLRQLDWVAMLFSSLSFSLMSAAYAITRTAGPLEPAYAMTAGLLVFTNTLVARTVFLPSRPGRTIGVGIIAALPIVLTTAWVLTASSVAMSPAAALFVTVTAAAWCALAIAVSAIGSQVIFGLRKDVALARQVGQYTLDEKIGEGGMGAVYKARHALLRRPTAIKLLPPGRAGLANVRRFEREVQQTARLTHANTDAIYDYGRTPDGVFYYAMEFLDGVTLDELVRTDGPLPPARAIHVLRQACGALGEAHDLGLVHRDVKPANIMLTERGGEADVVKVLDFGLVRHMDASGTEVTASAANILTGTPLYMAPEAIRSEDAVDGRSDLYALGAVAYFLLTGLPVFEGRTMVEVCAHHLHTAPLPPSARARVRVPLDLEAIVMRCLAKSPDERPRSARALRDALDRCADAGGWSGEEAARWWTAWRARPGRTRRLSPDETTGASVHQTVAVDLGGRVGGL